MRRLLILLALTAVLLPVGAAHAAGPSSIKHVWVVILENKTFETSFGPETKAPYLARELTAKGQLLPNYYGTSHASLGNYLTMISGVAPNLETQGDCPLYIDVLPGSLASGGQVNGIGCVYSGAVKTIADQLEEKRLTWKGYMEDIPTPCYHPAFGTLDTTQAAGKSSQYANRHNPFAYFHSVIDESSCAARVVGLDHLSTDLQSAATTPNFNFITPDLCNDGHDTPCEVDSRPGGLPSSDAFLRKWIPEITASPAYRKDGMIVITWDEASTSTAAACCGELTGPNTSMPGLTGPGGGRSGAVVLSPFVKPGSVNQTAYNHYSLLRSEEDIFGLPHLGYAAASGLKAFGSDVFNQPAAKAKISILSARRIKGCSSGRKAPIGKLRSGRPAGGKTVLTVSTTRRASLAFSALSGKTKLSLKARTIAACRRVRVSVPLTKGTVTVRARAGRTRTTHTVRLHR